MKKIIALFVIMLGFGFAANAQQKVSSDAVQKEQKDLKQLALKDVERLSTVVELTDDQKFSLKGLFLHKHQTLATPGLSQQRKDILAENIEAKLRATLNADQMEKLDASPKILEQITH